jgi:hypothetical protein
MTSLLLWCGAERSPIGLAACLTPLRAVGECVGMKQPGFLGISGASEARAPHPNPPLQAGEGIASRRGW